MSVLDNLPPVRLDYYMDGQQLKQDHELITAYQKSTEGVGLESLEENPSHQLVVQGLMDRYGDHIKLTHGNEGLLLIAAVVGGGYLAYKKFMRAKNNPVLKNTTNAEQNVDKTYDSKWIDGKTSTGKPVSVDELSKYFAGDNFGNMSGNITSAITKLASTTTKVVANAEQVWEKIAPIVRKWIGAKTDEDKKKYYDELKAAYPKNPFNELAEKLKEGHIPMNGKSSKIAALTISEYAAAVTLLKKAVEGLAAIDEASENLWDGLGFWDLFDDVDSDSAEAKTMWDYGYAENIGDYFGRGLWAARDEMLSVARGLEKLIINSYK